MKLIPALLKVYFLVITSKICKYTACHFASLSILTIYQNLLSARWIGCVSENVHFEGLMVLQILRNGTLENDLRHFEGPLSGINNPSN